MSKRDLLSSDDISIQLNSLTDWAVEENKLKKRNNMF